MGVLLESLERRTLFSATVAQATADLLKVRAAEAALLAHLNGGTRTFNSDLATLTFDLKRLSSNSANASLLSNLTTQGHASLNTLKKDLTGLTASINRGMTKALADYMAFARLFTNTVAAAALQTDVANLKTAAAARQQTVKTDATSADATQDADFNAIGSGNSSDTKTQTDVAKSVSDSDALGSQAQTDLKNIALALETFILAV